MVYAYKRGHKIVSEDAKTWVYADDRTSADVDRPCARCGRTPTEEGHDACLGDLGTDVIAACCGHGACDPYVMYRQATT